MLLREITMATSYLSKESVTLAKEDHLVDESPVGAEEQRHIITEEMDAEPRVFGAVKRRALQGGPQVALGCAIAFEVKDVYVEAIHGMESSSSEWLHAVFDWQFEGRLRELVDGLVRGDAQY
ncbi:hypothetical protein AeRB84_012713 [Aphanomyces euteiches]|nr:hypothetical protein AeRB84_012713 [Aphanomyces euteiches]